MLLAISGYRETTGLLTLIRTASSIGAFAHYDELVKEIGNEHSLRGYVTEGRGLILIAYLSTPGLNVWLTDADFEIILPNGQVFQRFTYKAGDTNWVPVEYRVALRNLSASPISFYHIEFKEDDKAITGQTNHQSASTAPANNDVS